MVIGSLLSSLGAQIAIIRPVIAFAIYASGLKYVGLATTTLGWVLCASLLAGGSAWLAVARPWRLSPADAPALPPALGALGPEGVPPAVEAPIIGE